MTNGMSSRQNGRLIAGVLLVLVGVLFTLDSFGILRAGDVFEYWPLILVGVGLAKIIGARRGHQRFAGVVIAALGALFLLRTLNLFWFRLHNLWPLVFLIGGGALLWQALSGRSAPPAEGGSMGEGVPDGMKAHPDASTSGRRGPAELGALLHEFAFMGGGDRVVRSQEFRGGEVTAILGGFKIDLRGAAIAGDSATIEIFTFWGGVDLRVPPEWNVAMHGTPILGMFSNSTHPTGGQVPGKTLVIEGAAVMGGVEVKN